MTTCTIAVGARRQYKVRVNAADVRFLRQWRWSFRRATWRYGATVHACRCVRRGGRPVNLFMHTVILTERMGLPRPSAGHTGDHRNIDSLDNRRGNLRWATHSEQRINQRRLTKAQMAAHAVAAAGCARAGWRKDARKGARKRKQKGR
jgi:hypothetical protein